MASPTRTLLLSALACFALVPTVPGAGEGGIRFRDVTRSTGISFVHTDGSSGRRYIVETVASGLALFDYNGDGRIDIYFLNGRPLPGAPMPQPPPRNALYRNDGHWRFTDVTEQAGVGGTGYALGVCVGDYNNDGFPDLYVNHFGPNVLYRNNGNGTFTDVTASAGVAVGPHVGAGAAFLDIDADGDLDLFVGNYIDFSYSTHRISHMGGFPAYVGPLDYPPTANWLFRNNGDGTFTDIGVESGIAAFKSSAMGLVAADYDNDGDTDLVVGNDLRPNFVFQNDGRGRFREVGLGLGLAYDGLGMVHGTMGVECADWDHDGWLDFFTTAYQRQLATLYRNHRGSGFEDVTRPTGAGTGSYNRVTWGVGFVDFDNDTHRDLYIACGHLIDNVEEFDDTTAYHSRNLLLRNNGQGKFVDVSESAGDGLQVKLSSRGAAFDDLDNDGAIDVVVLNHRREPTLLRNESKSRNHWIQLRLRGTRSNREAIGARVMVTTGDLTQIDEVHSGRSYQSDFGHRLHFGLGQRNRIDTLRVQWLGGGVDILRDVEVDRLLEVVEGAHSAVTVPAPGSPKSP